MGLIISGGGSSTPAAGSITNKQLSPAARTKGWAPTNAIAETISRMTRHDGLAVLSTGRLTVVGGAVIPGGSTVSSITFVTGSNPILSATNQWFCLVDQSLNVLKKTSDDTSTAWSANSPKTLNLSSSYTPTVDTPVYLGICVVQGGTMPNLLGGASNSGIMGIAPIICASSTSSLSDPASLGGTIAALSALGAAPYAYVS